MKQHSKGLLSVVWNDFVKREVYQSLVFHYHIAFSTKNLCSLELRHILKTFFFRVELFENKLGYK